MRTPKLLLLSLPWLLAAGCGTSPGNTGRSTRTERVRYLKTEAVGLDREAVELDKLVEDQQAAIKAYSKRIRDAKQDIKKLRRAEGREAGVRIEGAKAQIAYCEREIRSAERTVSRLKFEAKQLRLKASRTRREAWQIEKFTSEPIQEKEELPKYGVD